MSLFCKVVQYFAQSPSGFRLVRSVSHRCAAFRLVSLVCFSYRRSFSLCEGVTRRVYLFAAVAFALLCAPPLRCIFQDVQLRRWACVSLLFSAHIVVALFLVLICVPFVSPLFRACTHGMGPV